MNIEHVALAESKAASVLALRFALAKKTASDKSPKYRALLSMPEPLSGQCLDFPIFERNGDYQVAVPAAYGVDVLQVEPMKVELGDGRAVFVSNTENENGRNTMDRLLPLIKEQFLVWKHTVGNKPTQLNIHL